MWNAIGIIVWLVWTIFLSLNLWSNHENQKSNNELLGEIHKSNDLNDEMPAAVQKYCEATEHKSTAQDNLMWKSIIILAKRIHDLEDNNYIK